MPLGTLEFEPAILYDAGAAVWRSSGRQYAPAHPKAIPMPQQMATARRPGARWNPTVFEFHHISTEIELLSCTNNLQNWHDRDVAGLILSRRIRLDAMPHDQHDHSNTTLLGARMRAVMPAGLTDG